MKTRLASLVILVSSILLVSSQCGAQDLKAAARTAVAKWGDAVITVRVIASMKSGRGTEENQLELTGTVIDPSGLTFVSAQSIDPASMIKSFLSSMGRSSGSDNRMDSDITQTTMILQDGTEVDAEVVLKDQDLDFAFVRPKKPDRPLTFVPLLKAGSRPLEILEDLFVITRLTRSENRAIGLNQGRVQAVVKGPRTYYVPDQGIGAAGPGCIAFSADGTPVAVVVTKPRQNIGDKGMGMLMSMITGSGSGGAGSIQILRPIRDLMDDIEQARERKPTQSAPAAKP